MTTRTKTKTKVETEEVIEVKCPICDDWHDEDEMIPIVLDDVIHSNICQYHAESIFQFQSEQTSKAVMIKSLDSIDKRDIWITTSHIILAFTVIMGGAAMIMHASHTIMSTVPSNGNELFDLFPVLIVMPIVVYGLVRILDKDI